LKRLCIIAMTTWLVATSATAEESVDLDMLENIRNEGFNRSEVMESLRVLSDEIGPRLTASPAMRAASQWSIERFESWGIDDVYLEPFRFGRGWVMNRHEIHMTSPRQVQLHGLPIEYHPSTAGVLEGEIVYAPIKAEADFKAWTGKLQGKVVLLDDVQASRERQSKVYSRLSDAELDERARPADPLEGRKYTDSWAKELKFLQDLDVFLVREGAVAMVRNNNNTSMAINNDGYQHHAGLTPETPAVMLFTEHYERLLRLAAAGHVVRLSVDIDVSYFDDDHNGYNTIAEIPGRGPNPEIVMAGAHMDSHSTGDGASDNAAGVAIVMEAARILKALDVQTTRSIRFGLWSGEEQDIYGSAQYVRNNFGSFPNKIDAIFKNVGALEAADRSKNIVKAGEYDRFSVYFNVDGGAGKIRGIYTQGNAAAIPIFESWLLPLHDLGATHVTENYTGNTDHESFQLIGLPGYQFIQDRNLGNGGAHTQLDIYDEIYVEDLKQASVILASLLYHAAMRAERMPRK